MHAPLSTNPSTYSMLSFMKHISVDTFKTLLSVEANNPSVAFINVCTPQEYREKHIAGVQNIPLTDLSTRIAELRDKRTIYVHCRSGRRSQQALELLQREGLEAELVNVDGGLIGWEAAGLPTASLTASGIPLMRQVLLAAGLLILLGFVLAWTVSPWFLSIALVVGLGLSFAGLTGWCGMAFLLAKMPWNKA